MKKMKCKAAAFLIAVSMLNCMSGCFINDLLEHAQGQLFESVKFEDDSGYTQVTAETVADSAYYKPKAVTYGYDSLDSQTQKDCYNDMCTAVYRISEEKNEYDLYATGKVNIKDKSFTEKDLERLFLAVEWSSGHFPDKLAQTDIPTAQREISSLCSFIHM